MSSQKKPGGILAFPKYVDENLVQESLGYRNSGEEVVVWLKDMNALEQRRANKASEGSLGIDLMVARAVFALKKIKIGILEQELSPPVSNLDLNNILSRLSGKEADVLAKAYIKHFGDKSEDLEEDVKND